MYTDIAKDLDTFKIVLPNTVVPIPNDNDYEVGFIRRYFTQKANDTNGHIFEISYDTYKDLVKHPLWSCVDIKWRIKGPTNIIYKMDGDVDDVGVHNSNKAAITTASKILKNIGLYLPNLLQFYK
jgi:3',5'-cyclic AMP phosphodiesterase CpdA